MPVGCKLNQLVGPSSNITPSISGSFCPPTIARHMLMPIHGTAFLSPKYSVSFNQHVLISFLSLSGDVYFSRGQRTANLPDEVRAQVLVLGGHCE